MTKSALKGRADPPRACRGVIRATLLTLPLVVFVSLALVPMSANIDNSGICVHRCEAYADVTPTEYGYQFLEAVAGEAGLSVNDTVATVAGITASSTGLVIANSTGIVFGASGNRALDNLAEAADYPAWETLTSEQQSAWVSKDNYDASKFNALMDAFGLDQDRDRFYSSGGANFEFSQNSIDNIQRLGRIGSLWGSNVGVALSQITDAILNRNKIISWFPAGSATKVFDASQISDWPSGYPTLINYGYPVDILSVDYESRYRYRMYEFSIPVYGYIFIQNDNLACFTAFSTQPFTYNYGGTYADLRGTRSTTAARVASYKGNTFYWGGISATTNGYFNPSVNVNVQGNKNGFNTDVMGAILFGEGTTTSESGAESVPEYPEEELPGDTVIYYPPEGVSPTVVWPDYTEPQRPTNPYNPENETGTSQWEQETAQNVMPLQNIKFDKLFPFCLMTDVKDLTEKIEQTITPGQQSDYLKIRIPMAYASDGEGGSVSEDIEIDGTPLRDLLVSVRPFNQILLLFLMVFSLVMFWKSILTGD